MAEIVRVIKLQLHPDKKAAACLDDQSRKCNFLYNYLLERANQYKDEFKKTGNPQYAQIIYSTRGLRDLVPSIKVNYPYLKSVYAAPLKNTALRLSEAINASQNSHKGKRKGKKIKWPCFRSFKRSWFSLFYDEPYKGYAIKDNKLILSLGMGTDRKRHSLTIGLNAGHMLKGKQVRNLRIVKNNGIFSAVFTVLRTVPETKPIKTIIALDPNHKNLVYGVDNQGTALEIQAPSWLKVYDRRLDELAAMLSRCKKKSRLVTYVYHTGTIREVWESSRRFLKLKTVYTRVLTQRRELTKSFCYRIANLLYKHYDLVTIGDYTPHGQGITTAMRRALNNRSLIGRFKEIAAWVAIKSGKTYQEFDEKGTTRTCHACGFIVPEGIALSIRYWTCPGCSIGHIRDENAACNGLIKVLNKLVPGSGRVQVNERRAWRVLSSGTIVYRGDKAIVESIASRN